MNTTAKHTRVRLAVFGSRSLHGERVAQAILQAIEDVGATEIVTAAEPCGVCEVAREIARLTATPLKLHFLDRGSNARGAWHHRSVHVYEDCDHVLLVHDGQSKGTANELELADKMNIPRTYVQLAAGVQE